uniref:Reverse transcriptase domain-containing protein n=1 Tax=Cannabis sativa TaxID=3483 RepID=A0A803QDX6_CANSA
MVSFYTELFSTSGNLHNDILEDITPAITPEMNTDLLALVTHEEVRKSLFQMHPDKSLGPDGMTPSFFQKCWDIVGSDVVKLVRDFFDTASIPEDLNNTNLELILKKKNLENMGDLRPIALCNVVYKVSFKVMANRLKLFLADIVFENQSAFVPGRLITDNILVSFEIMHYLKRKGKGTVGQMALKLDMSKAYDRVEWPFLEVLLLKLGFHPRCVQLIMALVVSVRYWISSGGKFLGHTTPSWGIHQGDPLSPYLFIICTEVLSSLIRKYETKGWIKGCQVARGAPHITHMFFANDSYLYCRAPEREAQMVMTLLEKYELASGQIVNQEKSSIFFSKNTHSSTQESSCSIMGMPEVGDDGFYLGLPNIMKHNKNAVLGFLKDKMRKRVESWDSKFLSRAGKEVLIKLVAQSLPNYAMSVFLIPKGICEDLEQLMCKFWWKSSSKNKSGIHWMKWDRMCEAKDQGGMVFRHLHDFNIALLGKQAWRLHTLTNSLVGKLFKAKYYPRGSFISVEL